MLLAGFALLLHSYSGQDDIVIGSPVANRTRSEIENLIGYFVNVLPFRIDLHANPSFQGLVRRVHDLTQGVHAHQEMAFGKIVELVKPPRDPSRNPIYQVELTVLEPRNTPSVYGYGFQTIAEHSLHLGDVTMSPFPVESGVSKFDLTMLLWNLPDEIQGTIEYSTDLFETATIRAMSKRFVSVLDRALAGSELKISELSAFDDAAASGSRKRVSAVKRRPIRVAK
jgi:non-ribosomal peptide synthetase component F